MMNLHATVAAIVLIITSIASVAAQSAGGCSAGGTVYDPLLAPVPNATVRVFTYDWMPLAEGKTDGTGSFFFSDLPRTWVYCCAEAPGMTVGTKHTPPLEPGLPARVDIRLFAAASITGVVRGDSGEGVAGAQVVAAFDAAGIWLLPGRLPEAITDDSGSFKLEKVPLGDIAVRASADGYELGESKVQLREDAKVDVTMERGLGRKLVVEVDGVPKERVPDMRCLFFASPQYPKPTMRLPSRLTAARFGADAVCTVTGLPAGVALSMVRVEAEGMQFHPQWQEVEAGEDGHLKFQLDAITGPRPSRARAPAPVHDATPDVSPALPAAGAPTLRGTLKDENGEPLADTVVRLYCDRTGWRELVTGDDGSFAVAARYEVGDRIAFELASPHWVIDQEGGEPQGSRGSIWRAFKAGHFEELVATRATRIEGKLTTRGKVSVAGVRIVVEGPPATGGIRPCLAVAITDAQGAFTIGGVALTSGQVWLRVGGLAAVGEIGPLDIPRDRHLDRVVLEIEEPPEVAGVVIGQSGKPIPGARVSLSTSGFDLPNMMTLTDERGRFALRGMKVGSYTLRVRVTGDDVAAESARFDVDKKRVEQKISVDGG